MDFSVKTFYYTQLEGSIAYGCLRILISPDESKRQHCGRLSYDSVVVGDSKGQIHYYELRDSSLIEKAKTDPMSKGCARLEKLTRGGKISDKIMTAFGSMVAAYNVEGKQYFSFDSNLAEVLKWVVAEENKYVFACGEFMLNFYTINEGNIDDTYQYICPSEILDQYADSYDGMGYYVMLLCKDKKLRMINERGVVYETKLDHNAHSCYPFDENAYNFTNKKASGTRQMLLGMSNGEIRCYSVTQFEAKQLWSINASQMKSKSEAVLIRMFRLSGGSKCDIVVARADGNLEFYAQKDQPGQFELIAQTSINDTVTGLEGSVFNGTPVLMASTFSGKLVGVTLKNEYRGMEDVVATDGAKAEKERKISQLKKEIEELEKRVEAAKRTKQLEGVFVRIK